MDINYFEIIIIIIHILKFYFPCLNELEEFLNGYLQFDFV